MKHRFSISTIFAVLCICMIGCQEEMESRSLISKFRVLGVQANPPEAVAGDTVELRGLFATVAEHPASVAWVTLDTQWIAELGQSLPENIDDYSDEALSQLAGTLLSENSLTGTASLATPQFQLTTTAVDSISGEAVLPASHIEVSPALIALLRLMGQTDGFPVYLLACSNGVINEAALLQMVSQLTDSQQIGNLESACTGEDPAAIAIYKTVNIRFAGDSGSGTPDTDELNQNPAIQSLEIEEVPHPANTPPIDSGVIVCESADGCREPVTIRASVFKEDFQYYTGYERQSNEMEKMFVSWFANGGEFGNDRIRSDDAQKAVNALDDGKKQVLDALLANPEESHWFTVEWLPPIKGGMFDLWVVANDLRGGVGYAHFRIAVQTPNF